MIGLVVGKFYPPHKGHLFLIETAEIASDKVYVVVGDSPDESIPGKIRVKWLRQLVGPKTIVVNIPNNNPPGLTPVDPEYWTIWAKNLRDHLPEMPDAIFGSDVYIVKLAEAIDCDYALVDIHRNHVPISATQIRANPKKYWSFLPEVVQQYYAKNLDKSDKV